MLSVYKACWYAPTVGATARCNTFTLAKALAAINNSSARVINLSLGGPADPLLSKMLEQLVQQGRIVVAAMPPNERLDGFPNDVPGVLVVRSSSATPAMPGVLSAPGTDILTTQPNGRYDFTSGSSMATAHVSGMAALLLSLQPSMDAKALRALMQRTSKVSDGSCRSTPAPQCRRWRLTPDTQLTAPAWPSGFPCGCTNSVRRPRSIASPATCARGRWG